MLNTLFLMEYLPKDPHLLELERREQNRQRTHQLQKGFCPNCGEEAISLIQENQWECFCCHSTFKASYIHPISPLVKTYYK